MIWYFLTEDHRIRKTKKSNKVLSPPLSSEYFSQNIDPTLPPPPPPPHSESKNSHPHKQQFLRDLFSLPSVERWGPYAIVVYTPRVYLLEVKVKK